MMKIYLIDDDASVSVASLRNELVISSGCLIYVFTIG